MNSIIFSIIIPCYNVEKYLSKTIENVLNQTFQDFELILINDGSTDKTSEIINFYVQKDKRIKSIRKINEGVSKTRNLGIEIANGKYLYFLDGDDCIENNLLEKADQVLKNEEIGMFSFGFDVREKLNNKNYNNEKYNERIFNSKEFLRFFLKKEIDQSICSFIVKREYIKNMEFNSDLITGEDLDFQMKLLLKNNFNIYYDPFIYFHYMKRENSATTQKMIPFKNLKTLDCLNILRKEMLKQNIDEFKEYHIIRFFNIIRGLAKNGYDKKDYKKIEDKLKESKYILKDLKIEFSRKIILLNILKISYAINLKFILIIFKLNKFLNIKFNKRVGDKD